MSPARLALLGVSIIFVGFAVVAVGIFTGPGWSSSSGGFILVGPFPIVFGSGPNSGTLAAVGLAFTVGMVALYLLSVFLSRPRWRPEAEAYRGPIRASLPLRGG